MHCFWSLCLLQPGWFTLSLKTFQTWGEGKQPFNSLIGSFVSAFPLSAKAEKSAFLETLWAEIWNVNQNLSAQVSPSQEEKGCWKAPRVSATDKDIPSIYWIITPWGTRSVPRPFLVFLTLPQSLLAQIWVTSFLSINPGKTWNFNKAVISPCPIQWASKSKSERREGVCVGSIALD